MNIRIPKYSLSEELINAISHGIGSGLSIWLLVILIIKASNIGWLAVTSVTLYGSSMIMLYLISCIYHSLSKNVKAKGVFRIIDHCNVFLLVYGTIIPVFLLGIGGFKGFISFLIITIIIIGGMMLSIIAIDKYQILEVLCHLTVGWSVLLYKDDIINSMTINGLLFIILGGAMYTLGAILYGLGVKIKYMHSVFHILCLIGSLFHFIAIYIYLLA